MNGLIKHNALSTLYQHHNCSCVCVSVSGWSDCQCEKEGHSDKRQRKVCICMWQTDTQQKSHYYCGDGIKRKKAVIKTNDTIGKKQENYGSEVLHQSFV